MGIINYINRINYNVIRNKIFRREVESSFFNNKKFILPRIPKITKDSLLKFKEAYPFNFFSDEVSFKSAGVTVCEVENLQEIIAEADKIIDNKYNILNSGELYLGDEINWHYDYKSNYKWHEVLVWKDDFFKFPAGTDIKFPWELARFHQGIILGKAYIVTNDEKYVEKFLSLFNSFREKNPFCIGVNWLASDEIAIRLVNVFFAFSIMISSDKIDDEILNSFQEFILQHAVYIEHNLSYSKHNGHEYLSNILGLAVAGLLFNNTHYGKKNLLFAYPGFEHEIRTQVYDNGVAYEQSVPFHSSTLEHFYLAKVVLEKAGITLSSEFNKRLQCMFEVQDIYLREDFSIPQIGDINTSRLVPFTIDNIYNRYTYPLAAGKYLFGDIQLKSNPKPTSELVFLFGPGSIQRYNNTVHETDIHNSFALEKGGHYIMRDKNTHLFIEAGEIGRHGEGAPGHNDTFTFDLFYKSRQIIVDPGPYSYYADPELRNFLRSVRAHNTFYIDNYQLAEFEGLFKIKSDLTKPKVLHWETNNLEDKLSVQHYAYTRLPDPVICKRTFHFLKDKSIINIKDEFFGGTTHEIISNIHFHPEVDIYKVNKTEFKGSINNIAIEINFSSSSDFFTANIFDAKYSSSYGKLENTKKINVILKDKLPAFINTEIKLK